MSTKADARGIRQSALHALHGWNHLTILWLTYTSNYVVSIQLCRPSGPREQATSANAIHLRLSSVARALRPSGGQQCVRSSVRRCQDTSAKADSTTTIISKGKIGWGGRIRTFTIHINSVVSYRLDHAPAAVRPTDGRTNEVGSAASGSAKGFSKIARPSQDSATRPQKKCVFALACASQRVRCAKRTCLVDEAIFCKGTTLS